MAEDLLQELLQGFTVIFVIFLFFIFATRITDFVVILSEIFTMNLAKKKKEIIKAPPKSTHRKRKTTTRTQDWTCKCFYSLKALKCLIFDNPLIDYGAYLDIK